MGSQTGAEFYQDYLNSEHWQRVRADARREAKGCMITGDPSFDLHHLSYRNKWREKLWLDIIPLSAAMHHDFHEYAKEHGLENFEVLRWLKAIGRRVSPESFDVLQKAEAYWSGKARWTPGKKPKCKKKRRVSGPPKQKKRRSRRGFVDPDKPKRRKQWRDKTWVKLPKSEMV